MSRVRPTARHKYVHVASERAAPAPYVRFARMRKTMSVLTPVLAVSATALFALLVSTPRRALAAADPCEQSVCFQGAVISGMRVRPPALFLTIDGSLQVIDVTWSSWGPEVVRGSGAAVYETRGPGPRISIHVARVSVALSQTVACNAAHDVPNGLYYNRVRLTDRRTHKPVALRYLRRVQWAPCENP
jgi:hypothetical protein